METKAVLHVTGMSGKENNMDIQKMIRSLGLGIFVSAIFIGLLLASYSLFAFVFSTLGAAPAVVVTIFVVISAFVTIIAYTEDD